MSPEANQEIAVLRQKVSSNNYTPEELQRAIDLMRKARGQAAVTSAASKAKKAPVDSDKLLGELDGI